MFMKYNSGITQVNHMRCAPEKIGFFAVGGEKNKCQKRIKVEIQHKYEMTSCESEFFSLSLCLFEIDILCIEPKHTELIILCFICSTRRDSR